MPDAQQLVADPDVVVDRQLAPGLDADIGPGGIVIAEGDVGFGQAAQRRPRHRLALRIENLDHRIERRTKAAGVDLQNQAIVLLHGEGPRIFDARLVDTAVGRPGHLHAPIFRHPGRHPGDALVIGGHASDYKLAGGDYFGELAHDDVCIAQRSTFRRGDRHRET